MHVSDIQPPSSIQLTTIFVRNGIKTIVYWSFAWYKNHSAAQFFPNYLFILSTTSATTDAYLTDF